MILKGFYFRKNDDSLSILLFNMIVKRPNKVFTPLWQEGVAYRIISDRSQHPDIFPSLLSSRFNSSLLCYHQSSIPLLIPLRFSDCKIYSDQQKNNSIPGMHWSLNIDELRSHYVKFWLLVKMLRRLWPHVIVCKIRASFITSLWQRGSPGIH